jgi:hypothetical protein
MLRHTIFQYDQNDLKLIKKGAIVAIPNMHDGSGGLTLARFIRRNYTDTFIVDGWGTKSGETEVPEEACIPIWDFNHNNHGFWGTGDYHNIVMHKNALQLSYVRWIIDGSSYVLDQKGIQNDTPMEDVHSPTQFYPFYLVKNIIGERSLKNYPYPAYDEDGEEIIRCRDSGSTITYWMRNNLRVAEDATFPVCFNNCTAFIRNIIRDWASSSRSFCYCVRRDEESEWMTPQFLEHVKAPEQWIIAPLQTVIGEVINSMTASGFKYKEYKDG